MSPIGLKTDTAFVLTNWSVVLREFKQKENLPMFSVISLAVVASMVISIVDSIVELSAETSSIVELSAETSSV